MEPSVTLPNRPDPASDAPDNDEELDLVADGDLPEPIVFSLRPEEGGERLDKILSRRITQFSRSRIQQWIEEGHVLLDGKVARGKTPVYGDESVSVQPQPGLDAHAFEPEDMPLAVVHEDDALIVIDKAAGVVVHPGAGNWSGTLLNGLLHHFPELARVPRAGIVHRLDKDTSGL